jgi:hypothetical protein
MSFKVLARDSIERKHPKHVIERLRRTRT